MGLLVLHLLSGLHRGHLPLDTELLVHRSRHKKITQQQESDISGRAGIDLWCFLSHGMRVIIP